MTRAKFRHHVIEHIWRAIRASFFLTALIIWVNQDGMQTSDYVIIGLVVCAHLTEQFHGFICNKIAEVLHWASDFDLWE